ncbi:hypothetical protein HPC49_47295 [Pyxidicoccus fallax]|uniref:ABM domain-containing protein n=1 Tax=Pyxidicoccus fallax TaxID=394095 RepID=A0A848LTJ4_9BACT|nr:hypothetical protein [Pyxidicoccus fallax]NMO21308.1 hypothetical protein [Pyxidicoccus fallax]NPC85783.1 hypothetical protein [Pyxidicoccus fallax]
MKLPACDRITLVEVLQRTAPFDTFLSVIRAAVRRLEIEGVSGLVGVRFYARPDDSEVGAVITFADSSQVMDHIHMISGWPEFQALLGVVKPLEVRVHGRLGAEAQAWVRSMNVELKTFEDCVAGFMR